MTISCTPCLYCTHHYNTTHAPFTNPIVWFDTSTVIGIFYHHFVCDVMKPKRSKAKLNTNQIQINPNAVRASTLYENWIAWTQENGSAFQILPLCMNWLIKSWQKSIRSFDEKLWAFDSTVNWTDAIEQYNFSELFSKMVIWKPITALWILLSSNFIFPFQWFPFYYVPNEWYWITGFCTMH